LVQFISCPPTQQAQPSFSKLKFLFKKQQKIELFCPVGHQSKSATIISELKNDLKRQNNQCEALRVLNLPGFCFVRLVQNQFSWLQC
jgi:hypothetical protein